ncbi:MAG: hypothetical protein EBT42_04830 [Actinobacteria bacterium]|nr:hypothetical protein [Actinomycetota bacterium]
MTNIQIVPISGYENQIRELFWQTLTIGNPLSFDLTCSKQYEALGLNWYLTNGSRDGVVALVDEKVAGYCLVCLDGVSFRRAQRSQLFKLAGHVLIAFSTGRINSKSRRFYWHRFRDSLTILRTRKVLPANIDMHVHLNVVSGYNDGSISLRLRAHADNVCISSGSSAYFGEMNSIGKRRTVGLRRVGGEIIDQSSNRTFSWLTGQDIHRLTMVRYPVRQVLESATDSVLEPVLQAA